MTEIENNEQNLDQQEQATKQQIDPLDLMEAVLRQVILETCATGVPISQVVGLLECVKAQVLHDNIKLFVPIFGPAEQQ